MSDRGKDFRTACSPLGREALQKIGSFYWLRVFEMRQFGGELTPRPLRDMGISRFGLREMLQEPAAHR